MKIRKVNTWAEMESYREAWDGILAEISADIVFMTFEWLRAWWKYHGLGHDLCILVAIDGHEILGFIPLMIERGRLYDTIGFVGGHEASYMGIIARNGDKERFIGAALDHIIKLPGNILFEIHGLFRGTSDYLLIKRYLVQNKIGFLETGLECYYTEVEGRDFESYMRKRLGRGSIRTIKRKEKRLRRLGDLSFGPIDKNTEDMETVFSIHDKRWLRKVGSGKFSKGETKEFFNELALSPDLPFTTSTDIIRLNNRIIAFIYGFEYGGRYIFYRVGHEDDFGIFSPGEMVLREKIRDCFERGIRVFDFGAGYEPYKTIWGEGKSYVTGFLFPGNHLMVKAIYTLKKWKWGIKNWIKGHQGLYTLLKKGLGDIKYMVSSDQGFKPLRGKLTAAVAGMGRGIAFLYSTKTYMIMKLYHKNGAMVRDDHRVKEATIDDLGEIVSISGADTSYIIRRLLGGERCLLVHTGDRYFCLWYNLSKIELGEGAYSHTLCSGSLYIDDCAPNPKDKKLDIEVLRTAITYLGDRGYTKFYIVLSGREHPLYSMLKDEGFDEFAHIKFVKKMGRVSGRDLK